MWPNVSDENDAREFEKDVVSFDWTKMFYRLHVCFALIPLCHPYSTQTILQEYKILHVLYEYNNNRNSRDSK
jgi:hypothetical protein